MIRLCLCLRARPCPFPLLLITAAVASTSLGTMGTAHAATSSSDGAVDSLQTSSAKGTSANTRAANTATKSAANTAASAASLPAVKVVAAPPRTNDTSLKSDTASLGPLGTVKRLDTPYTINVVPQDVIESEQLRSVQDILRYLPSVQGDGARPQSRGIQGSVVQNTRIDGLNAVSTTDYSADEFQQVEVLNGLSGAIYGPANPAGTFNYVQKRPTNDRLLRFELGYGTHNRFTRGVDLSDRVGPTKAIGYRLTLSDETGSDYTANSSIRRQLASIAFDFHLSPKTVIETNFTYYHYIALGLPAQFTLATGAHLPAALDPNNAGYASANAGNNDTTTTATVRLRQELTPNWHLTAAVLRQTANRESTQPTYTISPNGTYKSTISTGTASQFTITSNQVSLNGDVYTGPIKHAISVGTSGFVWNSYNPYNGATVTQGTGLLSDPTSFALTGTPNFTSRYESANAWQQSLIAADNITFTPQWSVFLAGSQSWLGSHNYSLKGVQTSSSNNQGLSGSASLIFKPRANMTTYVTYADSLQQGDTATTGSANAGNILPPFRSKEWEIGYKIAFEKMNVSLAAFRIERPFAYVNSSTNIFQVAGEQRNKGVELMADGQVTRDLSLLGGITYLDPRLFNTASASTDGKRIVGLPHYALNVLAQYKIPHVEGLSTSFNVHYISSRPTDDANVNSVAGYTTFDLSAAYQTVIMDRLTTFRLGIYNLTNKHYWTNIYPGALNGYTGAGQASASLGAPRMVQATVQFEL